MRNLKRALSLALASIMVLGLMVVGASAAGYEDFTDKGEIKNTEAVNTMVSLGVISGKSDGSYDPSGSLTRAEACTLIARMLGGGKDPILGSNIKSNFKDTQGHWAETYIAYCANLGIIAGVGDGNFKPNDTLTGSAAAKMVLCALGYKPEFEGIGGANWELATNTLATKVKLYNGMETLNPSATISRDDVAQLIYNGVQAQEVEYTNLQGDYSGTLYAKDQGTMLENRFGVVKVTGVVEANEYFGLNQASTKAGKTQLNVRESVSYGAGSYSGVALYNLTTSAEMLGKEVVVYVQPASKLNPNPADDKILGDAIVTTKNTVYTTQDLLVNDSTKNNDATKALKTAGLSLQSGMTTYKNYGAIGDTNNAAGLAALTGRGFTTTVIDNTGDGKVDLILSYQPAFGKVTVYSNTGDGKITVSNLSSTTDPALTNKIADDVKGFENVAKGDYVFYTYVAADATYYVEKAEGTTVNVTSTKTAANRMDSTVVADGTTYKLSSIASSTDIDAASGAKTQLPLAVEIGKSAVFYLDQAGYVVYVDEVKTESKYLVATDSAKSGDFGDALIAKVILSDGTSSTVTVSKVDDKNVVATVSDPSTEVAADNDMLLTNKIYSYTVDSDGKYELKQATTITASSLKNNTPNVAAGLVASTTTPIIVKDSGSSATLYTGIGAAPTRNGATVLGVADSTTNVAKVIFVLNGTGVAADDSYMYFLSKTPTVTKDSDGKDVFTYDVIRDGKLTTIEGKSASITGLAAAGLYKASFDGEKVASVTPDARTASLSAVTVAADGVLSNGATSYYYNDSTVVYEVKDGVATESSIESIVVKQDDGSVVPGDNLTIMLGKGDTAGTANSTALYVFIQK